MPSIRAFGGARFSSPHYKGCSADCERCRENHSPGGTGHFGKLQNLFRGAAGGHEVRRGLPGLLVRTLRKSESGRTSGLPFSTHHSFSPAPQLPVHLRGAKVRSDSGGDSVLLPLSFSHERTVASEQHPGRSCLLISVRQMLENGAQTGRSQKSSFLSAPVRIPLRMCKKTWTIFPKK